MSPTISYKAMDTNKSYRAVFYDATLWISDFDFFKTELLFLASLLKSNSFKSNIPNLFESLQLLIKEIDQFIADNTILNEKVKRYNNEIEGLKTIFPIRRYLQLPYGFQAAPSDTNDTKNKPDDFTIGFVGRLDIYTKGLDLLVNSFHKFLQHAPKSKLWIIGDSNQKEKLKSMISALNI